MAMKLWANFEADSEVRTPMESGGTFGIIGRSLSLELDRVFMEEVTIDIPRPASTAAISPVALSYSSDAEGS